MTGLSTGGKGSPNRDSVDGTSKEEETVFAVGVTVLESWELLSKSLTMGGGKGGVTMACRPPLNGVPVAMERWGRSQNTLVWSDL